MVCPTDQAPKSLSGTTFSFSVFLPYRLEHGVPVHSLYAEPGQSVVMTAANKQLQWWRAEQVYSRTSVLGYVSLIILCMHSLLSCSADALSLYATTHPKVCVHKTIITAC